MAIRLTNGETLLIRRRRQGQTQTDVAKRTRHTPKAIAQFERGDVPCPFRLPLGKLGQSERCLILRRRANLTQAQVAERIGCSRWWVNQMENEGADPSELVEYWSGA